MKSRTIKQRKSKKRHSCPVSCPHKKKQFSKNALAELHKSIILPNELESLTQ